MYIKSVGPANKELSVKHVSWLNFIWRKLGTTESVVSVYSDKPRTICSSTVFFPDSSLEGSRDFLQIRILRYVFYLAFRTKILIFASSDNIGTHFNKQYYCNAERYNNGMLILEIGSDEKCLTLYRYVCHVIS